MNTFDRFYDKERLIKKTIEIENDSYDKLNAISKKKYNTSTNMLINACIEELLKTERIKMYLKKDKYSSTKHCLLIKESFVNGLEKLKDKYDVPFAKLVNIAIKNVLDEI